MNKELLDKIVSIHEEIENVKNKVKLVNRDDIPYVLYDNNSHLICSDRTIISDAISFIKERDRKSTRLNSSHSAKSRMPSSA